MPWPVGPTDPAGLAALAVAVRAAVDGSGPALAPVADTPEARAALGTLPPRVPDAVALVVRTSGSTGGPRWVLLDRSALVASAEATHERLGGPGRWLLALPPGHVAGLQVLVRSALAGTDAVLVEPPGSPAALARAVEEARGGRRYAALVPTQLHRVVSQASTGALPAALAALAQLDAVLVGGAAAPRPLLDAARALGLRVVTTYGMTETCGGCVYDGVPLDGVRVAVHDGAVRIAGPVLARGYLPAPEAGQAPFVVHDGVRWLRTADAGELRDGRLTLLGRLDDVLVTGGVKVRPAAVEAALAAVPGVGEVCVVGVPDAEWGQEVTAVVVPARPLRHAQTAGDAVTLVQLREAASRTLGSAAAPRRLVLVDALPQRGPGKVDRSAVARIAAEGRTARDGGQDHDGHSS